MPGTGSEWFVATDVLHYRQARTAGDKSAAFERILRLEAIYLYNKYGAPISYDLWRNVQRLLNYVCEHWREPDAGIWETRGNHRHFVYSKLMCWVALDRGVRLAMKRSFPADLERWLKTRDEIYLEIMERGWHQERDAFVQHYESDQVDAN